MVVEVKDEAFIKETLADRWNREIPVPAHVIEYVDSAVRKCLPPGTQVQGICQSGASFWARTAKIEAIDEDGEETSFFMKVNHRETGKMITESEFRCMTMLYSIIPESIAEPIACGSYEECEDVHFYICRFMDMVEFGQKRPSRQAAAELLVRLHQLGVNTEEQFGSPFDTRGAREPQVFPRSISWEECYTKGLAHEFENEAKTHGKDTEFEKVREEFVAKVIPRLLRPLETEGRKVLPTLVHGDLWDGNWAINALTGKPFIFDACVLYAHNEYDLGPWWCPRHRMTGQYIEAYKSRLEENARNPIKTKDDVEQENVLAISEPVEDFNDRGLLYMIRFDLRASSLYPDTLRRRGFVLDTMKQLLKKYPLGYEGYLLERGLATNAAVEANAAMSVAVESTGGPDAAALLADSVKAIDLAPAEESQARGAAEAKPIEATAQ